MQPNSRQIRETVAYFRSPTREIVQAAEQGFPYHELEDVSAAYGMSVRELASFLAIPPTTLYRRRGQGKLTPQESGRLYELASLLSLAVGVLGDLDEARRWLTAPALALGGMVPLIYAHSAPGLEAVKRLLHQIDQAVYV